MQDTFSIGFEHAPIGLIVSRHRVIEQCNKRFCEIFGYDRVDLEGQRLTKFYPSEREFIDIGTFGIDRMRKTGRYDDERIMKRGSGELFWCRVRGQSLTLDDPFAHSVWSFADLSEARPVVTLTRRERQVAMQLAEGKTSKEIALIFNVSPRTIEVYRAKILSKFECRNTAELIATLSGMPL